jgi:hypothetical protein
MDCVSSWTGDFKTHETQQALAPHALELLRELGLDRFEEERLSQ